MKLCKDCAHYAPHDYCRAPKNQKTDLVTGKVTCTLSAHKQRSSEWPAGKFCGSDGNWWEPNAATTNALLPVKKPWYKIWSR